MASKTDYDRIRVQAKEAEEQLKYKQALNENKYNENKEKNSLNNSYNSDVASLTKELQNEKDNQSMQKAKSQAEYVAQKRASTLRGILNGLGKENAEKKAENSAALETQNELNDIDYESNQNQTAIKDKLKEVRDNYISKLSEIESEKKQKDKAAEDEYKTALLSFYYKMIAENSKP